MILTTLIENLVYKKNLYAEHGLSFLIETRNNKILFDTGQSSKFYHNALQLEKKIEEVDYLIISHGHYDHTGGIETFLEVNKTAKIYIKPSALLKKYSKGRFIGMPEQLNIPKERLVTVEENIELYKNIFIIPNIKNYFSIDSHKENFTYQVDNIHYNDNFDDELFIAIRIDNKLTILSSCSHNGITNITETAKEYLKSPIDRVIGGFHTIGDNNSSIKHIIDYMNRNEIGKIGVCHCTGIENYNRIKDKCKGAVFYNHTANQINL